MRVVPTWLAIVCRLARFGLSRLIVPVKHSLPGPLYRGRFNVANSLFSHDRGARPNTVSVVVARQIGADALIGRRQFKAPAFGQLPDMGSVDFLPRCLMM